MDFLETLLPLHDSHQAFIPATIALSRLGCAESEALATRFGESNNAKIRLLNLRCQALVACGPSIQRCKLAPVEAHERVISSLRGG